MIKIGELLRKLWSLGICFLILPPGALTPQGIKGAMKRDVNNIGVPSSDVLAEVDLLHMRIERHENVTVCLSDECAYQSPNIRESSCLHTEAEINGRHFAISKCIILNEFRLRIHWRLFELTILQHWFR